VSREGLASIIRAWLKQERLALVDASGAVVGDNVVTEQLAELVIDAVKASPRTRRPPLRKTIKIPESIIDHLRALSTSEDLA
jgi:hypothetical protein